MTRYIGILDGTEDVWGVRVPDFAGCHGGGATPEEAIRDAISAMADLARDRRERGLPMPPARSTRELLQDQAVRAEMTEGDAFVVLPLIRETGMPARANISLDAGLLDAIDEAARARGLTRSAFLASAARDKILQGV